MSFQRTYQRGSKKSKEGGGAVKPLRTMHKQDDETLLDHAWKNVNEHLGDVAEDSDHDNIKEYAYTLAHDAIMDLGHTAATARRIAMKVKALA